MPKAKTNTIDNFKYGLEDVFPAKLVDWMDQNQGIFSKIMGDKAFASVVKEYLLKKVYKRVSEEV
jgi:type I restriction enzyme, R subunit